METRSEARAWRSRWAVPAPILALELGLLIAVLLVNDPVTQEELGFASMLLGLSTASILLLRRSRRLDDPERAAWRALGWSLAMAAAGVVATGAWSLVNGEVPAFGFHDLFFLVAYSFLVITAVQLARSDSGGANWVTTILDGLVGGVALGALVWAGFIHDLVDSFASAPWWHVVLGGLYPVLDIAVIVGLMVLVMRRTHFHFDLRLVFLAAGLVFQVLSDFVYLSRGVGRTFAEAQPAWPFLILASVFLIAVGSLVDVTPKKREFPDQSASLGALVWPYLIAAALLGTYVARFHSTVSNRDDVILLDALLAIGFLVFFRQIVQIHRNRKHVEQQRTELVSSVSHELRTPLTAMVGYLTMLNEEGDQFPDDLKKEMISAASEQAGHMNRLVSDLVILARGERSGMSLRLEPTSIQSIVTAVLRNVEVGESRINEEVTGTAMVGVDGDRVQQALSNLMSNAIRYGGDQVLLVAKTVDSDLVFEVHDNGPGVPTKFEDAIWKRFERGAHRLDSVTPGLGIGLAIVQAVATSHGGSADYRASERLGGACFSMTIPGYVIRSGPAIAVADQEALSTQRR